MVDENGVAVRVYESMKSDGWCIVISERSKNLKYFPLEICFNGKYVYLCPGSNPNQVTRPGSGARWRVWGGQDSGRPVWGTAPVRLIEKQRNAP